MNEKINLLEERLAGGTPQYVASEHDLSLDEYVDILKPSINKFRDNRANLVQEQLMIEHMRLERLVETNWENAINGDAKAADIILKVHDKMVKLCSLNINDGESGVIGDIIVSRTFVTKGELDAEG